MEPTEYPDDPNLRAFDAMMREVFPKPADRRVADTAAELDEMIAELRDLIAQMRASLAELRALRTKREAYKPWL